MISQASSLLALGWHEAIALPEFGIGAVFAKLDTGADHSVLHARDVVQLDDDRVEFALPLLLQQRSCLPFLEGGPRRMVAQLCDERIVKSSNGKEEIRYVISAAVELAGHTFTIPFSLTDRNGMRFAALLGRSALAGRFLVNSEAYHVASPELACEGGNHS
jgi:hypothetical protein